MALPASYRSAEKAEKLINEAYSEEFERKRTLDDKANNMMSSAGTVVTIYGGLGLTITTKLFTEMLHWNWQIFSLLIGVSLLVSCLFFASKANLVKSYNYATDYDAFVKEVIGDKVSFYDSDIESFMNRDPNNLHKLMIKKYIRCTLFNSKINDKRAFDLLFSQMIFFAALFTIPIFILTSIQFSS